MGVAKRQMEAGAAKQSDELTEGLVQFEGVGRIERPVQQNRF